MTLPRKVDRRIGPATASPQLDAKTVRLTCDFIRIAGTYTRLQRAGQQYVGLCPFHTERHPSFYVHPQRKIFHCFGCGVGGDVFDFIMRAERCGFRHALEIAAQGVAAVSEGRRPERFDGGVGAKPLRAAKRPAFHSPSVRDDRSRTLVRLERTERTLRSIRRTNDEHSRRLATACEPGREAPFTCQKPDNRSHE